MPEVQCDVCGDSIEFDRSDSGKVCDCKNCGNPVRLVNPAVKRKEQRAAASLAAMRQKTSSEPIVVTIIVATIAIVTAICCCGGCLLIGVAGRDVSTAGTTELVLVSDSISITAGGSITGTVVNESARRLSYVQIQFNLYDKSGAQVGSAMANVNGLEPSGKWKFEAHSFGQEYHGYKISSLTGR